MTDNTDRIRHPHPDTAGVVRRILDAYPELSDNGLYIPEFSAHGVHLDAH